eukprot:gene3347-13997_t
MSRDWTTDSLHCQLDTSERMVRPHGHTVMTELLHH